MLKNTLNIPNDDPENEPDFENEIIFSRTSETAIKTSQVVDAVNSSDGTDVIHHKPRTRIAFVKRKSNKINQIEVPIKIEASSNKESINIPTNDPGNEPDTGSENIITETAKRVIKTPQNVNAVKTSRARKVVQDSDWDAIEEIE